MAQNRDISSTFAKGMSVLKSFDDSQAQMSLADVSRKTNLDAATTRRLVLTLVELGYLKKHGRHFSLTPRILVLAGSFLGANQFGRLVQPVLNKYASEAGRGIFLAMLDETDVLLVAQSYLPSTKMTYGFTVGSRLPALHTAMGRMLLCQESDERIETLVKEAELKPYTQTTDTNKASLVRSLKQTSEDGFSVVKSEFEQGVIGISVPVGNGEEGRSVVGISDVEDLFQSEDDIKEAVVALKRCALEIRHTGVL